MRVLITGAAAGLAQGITVALARDKHDVSFTYRPGGTGPNETLELLRREGFPAKTYPVEFTGDERVVEVALEAAAQDRPEALVHAVGPMIIKRFERSSLDDYREMLEGNLRSAVLAARAVLPAMRAAKSGRLIFFGMRGSHQTRPMKGFAFHLAAKSGLVAFARTLALEEAQYGITVNVVEPGDIRDKKMTREQAAQISPRPGTWEDIAGAVRFFLDPENDFINGAVLPVDGGSTG